MPQPHPTGVRRAIFRLAGQGLAPAAIAHQLGVPASTVRVLLRRWHDVGPAALVPAYQACGRHQTAHPPALLPVVLGLHADHPRWGAGRLHVELADLHPGQPLPCPRTVQRWLRRHHARPAPPGRPAAAAAARTRVPHDVWQMDAVEQLPLATGQQVSWLRIADEASGAVLQTAVFPPQPLQPGAGRGRRPATPAGLGPLGR
jgi:hypothetical protein